MSFETLMSTIQRLNASAETLAALAAELKLRLDGAEADPKTRQLLQEIVQEIDANILNDLSPQQEAMALAAIQTSFNQTRDLLDEPARLPGWVHQDPTLLQTIGRQSVHIPHQIKKFAFRAKRLETNAGVTRYIS